ncbi:MAG: hypothetical protein BroJett029_17130 [Alphaproteobacteria bacterium]|nr:MAG: hypothetical protein BroJett029_17130 [Alphaproteobacteria bacterium]
MTDGSVRRILVADDEEDILAEYRRIFAGGLRIAADPAKALEAELFGARPAPPRPEFELTTCRSGDEAVDRVRAEMAAGRPFPVVYLDMRMPPGPSGIDTARAIRGIDPRVHIAIITGYSDIPPERIAELVPPVDRLFYFEKPFRAVELRQLAAALDAKWHAERRLEAARDQLEREVETRTADLRAAKEVAERANQAKTTFLANMSHELRTPLNAVIGFSDMMIAETLGPVGPTKYREYLADINESGRHLLSLINTILDLAKADCGKLSLYEERFALADAVVTALHLVEAQAIQGDVQLSSQRIGEGGDILGDRTKVLQILINILSNAVKFTPAGGRVRLDWGRVPGGAMQLRITDSGIGIRAEDIPRVLEPFSQLENATNRKYAGTGLGLPLSTALVELHGGTLRLDSTVGVGTTVTITFPAHRVAPQGEQRLQAS